MVMYLTPLGGGGGGGLGSGLQFWEFGFEVCVEEKGQDTSRNFKVGFWFMRTKLPM